MLSAMGQDGLDRVEERVSEILETFQRLKESEARARQARGHCIALQRRGARSWRWCGARGAVRRSGDAGGSDVEADVRAGARALER